MIKANCARVLMKVAGLAVVAAACGEDIQVPCTTEFNAQFLQARTAFRVGDTTTFRAHATTCGGTQSVPKAWRYSVEDPEIARIDSVSGVFTALAAGSTRVVAGEAGRSMVGHVFLLITVAP